MYFGNFLSCSERDHVEMPLTTSRQRHVALPLVILATLLGLVCVAGAGLDDECKSASSAASRWHLLLGATTVGYSP